MYKVDKTINDVPLKNFTFQTRQTNWDGLSKSNRLYHHYKYIYIYIYIYITSKVTQLVVNPRCDVAGFSYEVFHDRID